MKLFLATLFSVLFTLSAGAETLYIKHSKDASLNLRAGPGMHFHILRPLSPGERVAALERKGTWRRVRHEDGREGWISVNRLQARLKFGQNLTVVQNPSGYVILRSGPGSVYNDILRLYPGERTRLLDARGAWRKVAVRLDTVGWVDGRYLAE